MVIESKKYHQLENFLREISKTNKCSEEDWLPLYNKLLETDRQSTVLIDQKSQISRQPKWLKYLPRLAIAGFIEFVTMLLYTKISYGLAVHNETINPYSNIIIGAFVEGIGFLFATILITTKLGRKYSLIFFASLTSICVFIIPLIMRKYLQLTNIISQLGKLTVSSTVCVSWIYVPELFPTGMRGLANAVFVSVGSFGSILAPIIDEALGDKYLHISFYVYSALIILIVFSVIPLPETRNRSFNDDA